VSITAIEIAAAGAALLVCSIAILGLRRRSRRQPDLIVLYGRAVAALRTIIEHPQPVPDALEPDRPSSEAHVRVGVPPPTRRRVMKKSPTGRRTHRPNVESIAHRPTLANLPSISSPATHNWNDTGDR
jgi:hypothetical protein